MLLSIVRIDMHRLTARVLMVLLLAGVLAPVAMAISAPTPHACCLRKPMHDSRDAEFQAPPGCCDHDCCRPLTVSQWADLGPGAATCNSLPAAHLQSDALHADALSLTYHALSVRGPPPSSIA
jgi:hypothetical protein